MCNIFSRPATATGPVLPCTYISITWKDPPTKKKSKKSRGRKIDLLPLEKSLFFRRKNADFSARVARFFRKFWRSSGAKGRDLSLGFKASEKSEGTLPVQCDHSEAIARGSASRRRRQEPEIDHFTIKSRDCPIGQERSPPRSKRLAEKRIFAQLKFRSISITEREKTWQRPPGCSGSKLVHCILAYSRCIMGVLWGLQYAA